MNTPSSYTTRPRLGAVLERLRTLVSAEREDESLPPVTANVSPVTVERDDDRCEMQESCDWAAEDVDARLNQLTNGRWLRGWQRSGESEQRPPLIDEVDQSGVDRHLIAQVISPSVLERLEQEARRTRARLTREHVTSPGVKVWSFQHLLLQAIQEYVLSNTDTCGEHQRIPTAAKWAVGSTVLYSGERYTVSCVRGNRVSLVSETAGELDLFLSPTEVTRLQCHSDGA